MPAKKRFLLRLRASDARIIRMSVATLRKDKLALARVAAVMGISRPADIRLNDLVKFSDLRQEWERRRHYRLMRKVYAILRSKEWRIRYVRMYKNPKVCRRYDLVKGAIGNVHVEAKTIYIDFRWEVITLIVHECLHVILDGRFTGPRAYQREEKEVQRLEKFMVKHMSRIQAIRIHRLSAKRLSL